MSVRFLREPQSAWDTRALELIEAWDVEALIAEATYESLYRAGHATLAFLDFILAFGLAGIIVAFAALLFIYN